MTLTRRSLIASAAAFAAAPAFASSARIEADALAADVDILQTAYGAMHPGLYRYNTPRQMAGRFAELRAAFARPQSRSEAYVALARFTAAVRCGHTYPNPYNQTDPVAAELFGGRDRLPFDFRWIDGRMVVLRDLTGEGLARGSEITAIDGVPTRTLLSRMLPLVRADGSNDAKRVRNLELRSENRWEALDLLLPRVTSLGEAAVLTLREPSGRRRIERVRLLTGEERGKLAPPTGDSAARDVWRLERRPDGVAVMSMRTWAFYDGAFDWEAWLTEAMDRLTAERCKALIVDLRGNEGGRDCGDLIVARLIERPINPRPQRRLMRFQKTPEAINRHLETWDRSFRDWSAKSAGPDAQGFYALKEQSDDTITPAARRFGGRLIVLADASNSSATFQFGQIVKDFRLGHIVGQTSGGNRRGINGGAFFFLRLPGSGLEVDLPLIGTFPLTPQPDAGIAPDLAVRPSARAVANGEDQEMAAALAAIG